MMATTHLLAGAALVKVLRRPWLAWPAAGVSYFLLNAVPHTNAEQLVPASFSKPVLALDVCLGIILLAWLTRSQPQRRAMLGAGLVVALTALLTHEGSLLPWLSALRYQTELGPVHVQWPVGVAMQVAFLAGGVLVVRGRGSLSLPDLRLPPKRRAGGTGSGDEFPE